VSLIAFPSYSKRWPLVDDAVERGQLHILPRPNLGFYARVHGHPQGKYVFKIPLIRELCPGPSTLLNRLLYRLMVSLLDW